MRIFHIALLSEWEAAQASGTYTTSTLGRTLADEGFIHASRGDQWPGVRDRYYADVEEQLVLLAIDPDLLTVPVVEEEVPGGETFPHIYGPLNADAVVRVLPLDAAASPQPDPQRPAQQAPRLDKTPEPAPNQAPVPARPARPQQSFAQVFFGELFFRCLIAVAILALAVAGLSLGAELGGDVGGLVGMALAVIAGVVGARIAIRRRDERLKTVAHVTDSRD